MHSSKPFSPHPILKVLLLIAIGLSATMAVITAFNRHPDESEHFPAARYYTSQFFPPEIGDAAVRDSYSVFGVSYLNYHWAEYFFAGKFMLVVSPVIGDPVVAARLSATFLFAVLAALFLYRSWNDNTEFILPGFLLVTPQLWYIFGYINNDAFALFTSFLAAYEIAYPKSLLNGFLTSDSFSSRIAGGVWFGILCGLLLTVKPNYWTFLVFIGLWLLATFGFNARLAKKFAFIGLIAIAVLTFRIGLDFYSNGETNFVGFSYVNKFFGNLESEGRLAAYQEEVAEYPFRPSTLEHDLGNSYDGLRLRDKGTSLSQLFTERKWHVTSLKSFVGVYGYVDVWAGPLYYQAILGLYFLFIAYVILSIIRSRDRKSIVQLTIVSFCTLLTVFVSVMLSWLYAFQPQGRYLFPVVAMFALLVYANRQYLNNLIVHVFLIGSFLLSVYSFVFWGLIGLA